MDNWVQVISGLVGLGIGLVLKIVFDELRSPNLRIVGASQPFSISPEIRIIGEGFDNLYSAYRIRVENRQKLFLNCAAENCMAWLELDSVPESYQICWVGNCSDVTINVGDVREIDFVARGKTTGRICAPTERGYFEPLPREIGDGKTDLQGRLKITSKNGKREEKRFVIKPNKEQLEIIFPDGRSKEVTNNASYPDEQRKSDSALKSKLNNQEPITFKPLPWGVLFFSFWATLRTVDSPPPLIEGVAWFFLALSGILLLSIFTRPLSSLFRRILAKYVPRLNRIVTRENVSWFFVSLVFYTTFLGFPVNIVMKWSKLEAIDISISIVGVVCWMIAYVLVLVSIVSRLGRKGQVIGGIVSAIIIGYAINAFRSNVLAGLIVLTIGVASMTIVIKPPKATWDLSQVV